MRGAVVVLLGGLDIDRQDFDAIAAEFSWLVVHAGDLASLREISAAETVIAVLFHANNAGWRDALESVLAAAPTALPIACANFAESIPWPNLADSGAFHELRLPIDTGEVRRSLGFVWAAKSTEQPADAETTPQRAPVAKSLTAGSVAGEGDGFAFSDRFVISKSQNR